MPTVDGEQTGAPITIIFEPWPADKNGIYYFQGPMSWQVSVDELTAFAELADANGYVRVPIMGFDVICQTLRINPTPLTVTHE